MQEPDTSAEPPPRDPAPAAPQAAPAPAPRREPDLARLQGLVRRLEGRAPRELSDQELAELPRLYRRAATRLAQLRTSGHDPRSERAAAELVHAAHAALHRDLRGARVPWWRRAAGLLLVRSPRAIRAEWRLLLLQLGLFYGLALLAYGLVARDLETAFSLMSPEVVAGEVQQLRATEEGAPFRGNFTFGMDLAAPISGWILAHNISVSLLFFGSALVPPVYLVLLTSNALMVGTYTAVAGHWGQAGAISSLLWCHGMIELQMIVLAGAAGLVLVRAWIAPGPWSRSRALEQAGTRAWELLAPIFPGLFVSGLIEGYVTPAASTPVRAAFAVGSAVLLAAWVGLCGRRRAPG